MTDNEKPVPLKEQVPIFDDVKGGYNSPKYEQRPAPPAKPPAKPKKE